MTEHSTDALVPDTPRCNPTTEGTLGNIRRPRIAFRTLGCKLNQYETDALASRFQDHGYTIVDSRAEADCYVVNTCTVTNKGDRKSRNAINRSVRRKDFLAESRPRDGSPSPLVVVTGCFAESHRDELEQDSRLVTVGNEQKQAIVELVNAHFSGEYLRPDELPRDVFNFGVPEPVFHTRSMIKVQDGCDNYCTFCIIPFVRGRARSRNAQEIRDELKESLDHGYREIVLTGVNISRYNDDGTPFSSLVQSLLEIEGDYRIRLSSLEPDMLDDRFFDLFSHPRMAPHLHLCLQSGSERILLQMRRQYTAGGYRAIANRLLERYPGFNLTTDCIVGFPGETDEEFAHTCNMVRELGFTHVHTFPYSVRSGTRAERIPGHISGRVKAERSRQLRAISEENRDAYYRRMVGEKGTLLVERVAHGVAHGYTEQYIPTAVPVPASMQESNSLIDVAFRSIGTSSEQSYMNAEPLS